MTIDEYAALELRLGARLIRVGEVWWRRVRPFFYRPLLCYELLDEACLKPPVGCLGAFQYAVTDPAVSNSTINYLVLDRLQEYDVTKLGRRKRQLLNQATRTFTVREINEPEELKSGAYPVYVSFYKRSGYTYLRQRRRKPDFDRWVDIIFDFGRPFVLGGYEGNELKGVSVSYRLMDTVIYATLFVETEALKKNLGELMLHELRVRAAEEEGVKQVFLRPYHGANSQDRYYMRRGATLVRQPARLHVHPMVLALLRMVSPQHHAALVGNW